MVLHHLLDRLDHHDRIIHHDTDREHDRKKRDGVGRIADCVQHDERADQADRDSNRRNQRGTQISQEQIDDEHDQNERLDQGFLHLMDRGGDKRRRVVCDLPGQVIGKVARRGGHGLLDASERGEGIGAGRLIDRHQRRRGSV